MEITDPDGWQKEASIYNQPKMVKSDLVHDNLLGKELRCKDPDKKVNHYFHAINIRDKPLQTFLAYLRHLF